MADSDLPTGLPARLLHRLGWHRKRNDFSGDEIREEELKQIDNRRDVAFIDNEGRSERQLPIEKDLVGIALSGGGLRSAMLNLGLLQSLCKRGFLKHVDFLSGVSGGGYIASYFSKRVVENGFHINEAMEDMAPGSDGKGEPKHVRELIRDGKYLEQPIRALSRYLIGFLWNSVFLVSLLVLFASAAAFVWRCLDDGWLYSWLREITISWPGLLKSSDATRPFLIPVLLFVCWLLAWAAHFVFRGAHQPNRLASHLLLGTLASALIGIAVFLSNGDVVIVPDYWNQGPTVNFRNSPQFVTALVAVLLLLSVFMIPLLKPKELLKSARAPRESAKHWMYRAAMVGSFLGVPFMAVYYFAGENFSNRSLFSNSSLKEDYELKTGHVFNWADLLREIEHGRSNQNGLPSPIWKNLKKDKDVIDQLQRELTTAELKQVHLTKQEKQGWKRIDLIQYRRHLHARESDESLKKSLLDAINAVVND
ncbi:MAG: hypothetical protein HON53_00015, partial [Planctomycetaceae bacterium]|nr:hypothetical protein [Planctomycetaceae bacterium]